MLVKHKTVLLVVSAKKMSVTITIKYVLFHFTILLPDLCWCTVLLILEP